MNKESTNSQMTPMQNETSSQNNNPKSFAVIILAILLLITLFIFGAYIYFKEIYEPESVNISTTGPTMIVPTQTEPSTVVASSVYEEVTLDLSTKLDEFDNVKSEWEITKPSDSELEYDDNEGRYIIYGEDFDMQISSDYEDEGYNTTPYNQNYVKLKHELYGDFYRVQSDIATIGNGEFEYFYVDDDSFKVTGNCAIPQGELVNPIEAPCGDSMLGLRSPGQENLEALFKIVCTANNEEGLDECDKIVASLKKI